MIKISLNTLMSAVLLSAVSASANITLIDSTVNDGSFESVYVPPSGGTFKVDAFSTTNIGSVWTYANNGSANNAGWLGSASVALYSDNNDFTNTVTSIDILGTGGYNTVSAGDQYAWSFDVWARFGGANLGTNSFGSLALSFDGGANWIVVGSLIDGDQDNDWETATGTYTVTAQNAIDAATYGLMVQGAFGDRMDDGGNYANVRFDNIQLVLLEPESELVLTPSDLLSLVVDAPQTVSTGIVEVAFNFGSENNTVEISSVSVVNQQHPGSFSVLNFPASLTDPAPSNGLISVEFDQSVAGLASGQTSTGTVQVVWNETGKLVNHTNSVPVSALFQQPILFTWSAQFLTDPASDVSLNGSLLEALNFGGGTNAADYDTTLNGVTFSGLVSGASGSTTWVGPQGAYFSSDSARVSRDTDDAYDVADGGLAEYDALLSRFLWGGNGGGTGGNTVTLKGLTIGQDYEVQLFFGDTSATDADRWIVIDEGEATAYGADGLSNHKAPIGEPGRAGLVLTATFTATVTNGSFTITQWDNTAVPPAPTPNPFHLNAYQLRSLSGASAAHLQIAAGTGGNLSIIGSNLTASATYALQGSLNLASNNWVTIGTTSGVTTVNWLNVVAPTNKAGFFRMISE